MQPRPLYLIHVHPQPSCSAEHSGTSDSMSCPRYDSGDRAISLSSVAAPPGGILAAGGFPTHALPPSHATLGTHVQLPVAATGSLQHPAPHPSQPVQGALGSCWAAQTTRAGWASLPCEGCGSDTGRKTHITSGHWFQVSLPYPLVWDFWD